MLDFSTYLLYRAAAALVALLPLRLGFAAGKLCGWFAWVVAVKYRNLARRNIGIAFGIEKTPGEIGRLVRRHFQNLGANLVSGIKLASMPLEQVAEVLETDGMEQLEKALRSGRGAVLALSHMGNWESFTRMAPHHLGFAPLATVYQRLGNSYLDRHVSAQRARFGVQPLDRSKGFQKAIELLRRGGLLGILSDQHAGDHGVWTPFFGRLASTSPLAGLLTRRTGAALFAAAVYTTGPARWRVVFSEQLNTKENDVDALAARVNGVIEQQVRRSPEDWFWVHNRWKTPRPKFLLTEYKRGIHVPTELPAESLKPFRIVIRASNWLGDSIISMPAVTAIKKGRPDAHVTVVAPGKTAAVWRLLPEVDDVIALPGKSVVAAARLLRQKAPFDVGIVFPNSLRSVIEMWLARVPRRVAYEGHHRRWLLNQVVRQPVRRGPPEHQASHYLNIAEALGAHVHPLQIPVRPPPAISATTTPQLGLCPGAEYGPAKRWLPTHFGEVAATVAAKARVQWILFGTGNDKEVGAEVVAASGLPCVNRIGETTLEQLIAELRECRLLLTNDTGTMHLATLLGVPVVAVFGSTEPRLTGPLGTSRVIRHQVECSPCFLRECPIDFRCMHAVTTAEVTAAVLETLGADRL